jgi:hypothetical protein
LIPPEERLAHLASRYSGYLLYDYKSTNTDANALFFLVFFSLLASLASSGISELIPRAQKVTIRSDSNVFGMHPFYIPMGPTVSTARPSTARPFCLFESMHPSFFK